MTADYLRGRRARYVPPFKLCLVTSVLVFGAAQWFGLNLGLQFYGTHGVPIHRGTRLSAEQADAPLTRLMPVRIVLEQLDTPAARRFAALSPEDRFAFLRARRAPYASSFVLFLVPLFALALDLFYRERRYAEHLVFGLHCQTFLLLVLLAQAKLSPVLANVCRRPAHVVGSGRVNQPVPQVGARFGFVQGPGRQDARERAAIRGRAALG